MKTQKSMALLAGWILAVCLTLAGARTVRAEGSLPLAADNTSRIYLQKLTGLISTGTGYERVFPDADDVLTVERYNENFELQGRLTLPTELSFYGGSFSGANANYLVFGQNNKEEDNAVEVVRVVKYSKDWQRLGAASLRGDSAFAHEIRYPFDVGNNNMAEYGGKLYLVTGHEGYVDPQYNQGHQGFLMFEIDEASMTGRIADADLWHSFSQHIAIRDAGRKYVLEESEGSQFAKLTWYTGEKDYRGDEVVKSIPVLHYGGERTSAWAVPTYATTDGIALSSGNILTVGTSIDQSRYNDDTYTKTYNIYVTVTPMDNFTEEATSFRWLTSDNVKGGYKGVYLTKISDDRFMVSWETGNEDSVAGEGEYDSMSSHVLHYVFLNGNGETISRVFTRPAAISCCVPVVKNGKVVFYAADAGTVAFYTIDASTGDFTKKVYRLAGKEAVWDFADGVLTVSGSGALYEKLASSALKAIEDKVTKVVVKAGISQVSAQTFAYLDSLEEAVLERGVTTLKDRAFYGNDKLRRVAVPSTLTSFGERVFDTGWTWIGSGDPVIYANLHCEAGSAALAYAEKHNIRHTLTAVTMEDLSLLYGQAADTMPEPKVVATTGKPGPVLFYTDEACTKLTSAENGAAAAGGVPANAGVYYMKADAAADEVFGAVAGTPARYEIRPLPLDGASVAVPEKEYTGKALTPAPTVTLNGKTLQKDIDYTVKEYRDNIEAGTAVVTVEGKGNYTGTKEGRFTIRKKAAAEQPGTEQPGSEKPGTEQPGSEKPGSAEPPAETDPKTAVRPAEDQTPDQPGRLTETKDRIAAVKDDTKDVKGSTFSLLRAKGTAKSKTSVKISWKKVTGAKKYMIYGNACGKGKKYKLLKTLGKSKTSWTQKKLKKGKYYKYLVVAVNGSKVLASSKTIHVATSGGKVGNYTSISLNKKKLTLKKGKSATVKATVKSGKLKVKKHRATAWESSDISVATVSKGKIRAVGQGTCTIYAYAQNGICASVKVTVE